MAESEFDSNDGFIAADRSTDTHMEETRTPDTNRAEAFAAVIHSDTEREECTSNGDSMSHHSDDVNGKRLDASAVQDLTRSTSMKPTPSRRMTGASERGMGFKRRETVARYSQFQTVNNIEKLHSGVGELVAPLLQISFILAYISIFALIFSTLEHCPYYPDAFYWAVVTLFTIGFGDVVPLTGAMRAWTIFYVLFGITVIVSAISVVLESLKTVRLQFRSVERRNVKVLAAQAEVNARKHQTGENIAPAMFILPEEDYDMLVGEFTIKNVFRERIAILLKVIVALVLITAIGALGYWGLERYDALVSIYMAVVTLSTVGYGDIPITKDTTKTFVIFFVLVALPIYTTCLSSMMTTISQMFELRRIKRWTAEGVTPEMIMEADKNGNGTVDRTEFTLYYLEKLGRIESHDVRLIQSLFDKYDRDGSGTLDVNDFCIDNDNSSTK